MKKVGKIGRINAKANKLIEQMWIDKDITYCEYPYLHVCSGGTSNAHRHKRVWYRSSLELLWDFKQVIKICLNAHNLIEKDAELTKKVFEELRGGRMIIQVIRSMTKPLTPSQKVKVVEYLLDISNYDEEAKESKLLNLIYRVIHPSKKCRHLNWEKEAREILEEIND